MAILHFQTNCDVTSEPETGGSSSATLTAAEDGDRRAAVGMETIIPAQDDEEYETVVPREQAQASAVVNGHSRCANRPQSLLLMYCKQFPLF